MTLSHTDPAVLATLLDWYRGELQREAGSWLPKMTHSGWHQRADSGMTPSDWHECEQCNGTGRTKRGSCRNCDANGGWNTDPYDSDDKRIGSTETSVERGMTQSELDHALELGQAPLTLEQELVRMLSPTHAPALRKVEDALIRMRPEYPHFRGALVCRHLLGLPYVEENYQGGIVILTKLLGPHFRAPGWLLLGVEHRIHTVKDLREKDARRKARERAA